MEMKTSLIILLLFRLQFEFYCFFSPHYYAVSVRRSPFRFLATVAVRKCFPKRRKQSFRCKGKRRTRVNVNGAIVNKEIGMKWDRIPSVKM